MKTVDQIRRYLLCDNCYMEYTVDICQPIKKRIYKKIIGN